MQVGVVRAAEEDQDRQTQIRHAHQQTAQREPVLVPVHQHGGQVVQNDAAIGQHEHDILRLRADPPDQGVHQRHEQVDEEEHEQPEQGDAELRRHAVFQGRPIEPLPPAGVQHVRPEKGQDADGAPLAQVRTQRRAGD